MTYLLSYLHPLQPFSKEAEAEAEPVADAKALKEIRSGSGSGSRSKSHCFHISGGTKLMFLHIFPKKINDKISINLT